MRNTAERSGDHEDSVASAVSGGRGDGIWRGALAGAGVTVIGGALLDILTTNRNGTVTYVTRTQPVTVVRPVVTTPARRPAPVSRARRIYRQGFRDGYREGYADGYSDAIYWY